jgi:hypothetical protein
MRITQFEHARKLHDRIKELDAEIIGLERAASDIANKQADIRISMEVNDRERVHFDESVSSPYGRSPLFEMMFPGLSHSHIKPTQKGHIIKQDHVISDSVALQVLGVLLAEKLEARALAIKALNKIGIEI